jgi:hypothetical protein
MADAQETLRRVHELRWKAHWGDRHDTSQRPWPKTEAEWRQTPHGAPWDANVHMAQWHLDFARKLQAEGLLDG